MEKARRAAVPFMGRANNLYSSNSYFCESPDGSDPNRLLCITWTLGECCYAHFCQISLDLEVCWPCGHPPPRPFPLPELF